MLLVRGRRQRLLSSVDKTPFYLANFPRYFVDLDYG